MEKVKALKSILLERTLHREIKCRANALPLKSMIYAIAHAKSKVSTTGNPNASFYMKLLTSHSKTLDLITRSLHMSVEPDSDTIYRNLKTSTSAYVNLFYALSKTERESYIKRVNRVRLFKQIPPQDNLLLIPAAMAEKKAEKQTLIAGVATTLYTMPLKVLYDTGSSALDVASFEDKTAVKRMPTDALREFSNALSALSSRIELVGRGTIKPKEDESAKSDYITSALEFSSATGINFADLIGQKVETSRVTLIRMHRILRRYRHIRN